MISVHKCPKNSGLDRFFFVFCLKKKKDYNMLKNKKNNSQLVPQFADNNADPDII